MNKKTRQLLLLLLLILIGTILYQRPVIKGVNATPTKVDKKQELALDAKTQAQIKAYFEGVNIKPEENSLAYAIQLDHSVGRKHQLSGNFKAVYETYRKILAISYNQGSLMGMGISLGALSGVMQKIRNYDEAINLAFLEYKVSRSLNQRYEYGVTELRLSQLMGSRDRSLGMAWRLRSRQSLQGTPHKQDYIMLLSQLVDDYVWMKKPQQALTVAEEAWNLAQSTGMSSDEKTARYHAADVYSALLHETNHCDQVIPLIKQVTSQFSEQEKTSLSYYALLSTMASCYNEQGDRSQARQYYTEALNYYELARSYALGDVARAKLDQENRHRIDQLVNIYLQEQDYYSALALLETSKARTLADIREDSGQQGVYRQLTDLQRQHAQERTAFFKSAEQVQLSTDELEQDSLDAVKSVKVSNYGQTMPGYWSSNANSNNNYKQHYKYAMFPLALMLLPIKSGRYNID